MYDEITLLYFYNFVNFHFGNAVNDIGNRHAQCLMPVIEVTQNSCNIRASHYKVQAAQNSRLSRLTSNVIGARTQKKIRVKLKYLN